MKERANQVPITKTKATLMELFFLNFNSYHSNEVSTHSHGLLHLFFACTLGTVN
jgi:hypothetical protein